MRVKKDVRQTTLFTEEQVESMRKLANALGYFSLGAFIRDCMEREIRLVRNERRGGETLARSRDGVDRLVLLK